MIYFLLNRWRSLMRLTPQESLESELFNAYTTYSVRRVVGSSDINITRGLLVRLEIWPAKTFLQGLSHLLNNIATLVALITHASFAVDDPLRSEYAELSASLATWLAQWECTAGLNPKPPTVPAIGRALDAAMCTTICVSVSLNAESSHSFQLGLSQVRGDPSGFQGYVWAKALMGPLWPSWMYIDQSYNAEYFVGPPRQYPQRT